MIFLYLGFIKSELFPRLGLVSRLAVLLRSADRAGVEEAVLEVDGRRGRPRVDVPSAAVAEGLEGVDGDAYVE